jgi:hypothetical protein
VIRARFAKFVEAHAGLIALSFGLAVSAGIICGVEIAFQWLAKAKDKAQGIEDVRYSPSPWAPYSIYGTALLRGVHTRNTKYLRYKELYSAEYTLDEYGRRITPIRNRSQRSKFAVFFGCSLMFGEGVSADKTLPARFAEYAPDYMPYNYGGPGHGPQQLLLRLQIGGIQREIRETRGTAFYTYIDHHISRAIGSMRVFEIWGRRFPYYDYWNGNLVYRGDFETGRPIRTYVYDHILSKEGILSYFQADWPLWTSQRDARLTADLIVQASERFKSIFPESKFIVLMYPQPSRTHDSEMTALLKERGVECLDYQGMFDDVDSDTVQYPDHGHHPKAPSYDIVARKLAEDLGASSRVPAGARKPRQ